MMEYKRVPITGYEGLYEIDTNGDVFSLITGIKLKPFDNGCGYLEVYLHKNGSRKVYTVHRLVAKEFIPNPNNYPVINHKDEIRTNNAASNLEWCTHWYNIHYGTGIERAVKARAWFRRSPEQNREHSEKMKRYKRETSTVRFECVNDGKVYITYTDAADEYNLDRHDVSDVCKGKKKSVKGYVFRPI